MPVAPVLPAAEPQPVFEHPSFTARPTLRAEREGTAPKRVEPTGERITPRITVTPNEAPFVDLTRSRNPADLTPPPLRVTQGRASSRPSSERAKPRYMGLILTVMLLIALAVVAAISAFYTNDTADTAEAAPHGNLSLAAVAAPAAAADLVPPGQSTTPEAHDAQVLPVVAEDAVPAATAPVTMLAAADTAPAAPATETAATEPVVPDATAPETIELAQAAPPSTRPRVRPTTETSQTATAPEAASPPDAAFVVAGMPDTRPRLRPEDLVPTQEEMAEAEDVEGALEASPRPLGRPELAANAAIVATDAGTPLAVAVSQRPEMRPSGVSRASVNAALAAAMVPDPTPAAVAPPAQTRTAPAPAPAPAAREAEADDEPEPVPTAPSIPTRASVAQNATEQNAMPLGQTNIISITGKSSSRTALVRSGNGRISRLRVGDRIDGGVVAAITENAIHYRKGNQLYALNMPG